MTFNTPLLWVVLPIIMAALVGIFYNRKLLSIVLTSATAFILALLAVFFPQNLTLAVGPIVMIFEESLDILGRQIIVDYDLLPFIAFIYTMTGLWGLSSGIAGTPRVFRPAILILTALMTAALGVEPFLYAALLIQIAILTSIPMLSPYGKKVEAGILRYLTLETLAMPFILLAGWLLTGVEILPPESPLVGQTTILLGLGFALWLGIFPFHSWLPMVSQHSHPNVFSFLLFLLPTTILVFSLNFFDRYTFLRTLPELDQTLRLFGTLMILVGGLWTAIQHNLKRAFGFSVLTEIGFSLLAMSHTSQGGLVWMMMLFPARVLAFWLWGYTLSLIESRVGTMDTQSIRGFARTHPVLTTGLLLAQLSLAGLPLLGSFPIKIRILSATFETSSTLGIWSFIGSLGLFLFSLRLLAVLVTPLNETISQRWSSLEKPYEYLPIIIMILVLLILGLFPHTLLNGIVNTLTAFNQLQ